jgi:predicted RNA-binding protein with PIN domain
MIIIDGHNLIGASKNISLSDPLSKEKILSTLDKYQKILDRKIVVVFDRNTNDGYERSDYNNIEVRYPLNGRTADDIIIDLITKYRNQHSVCIVSSDNELINKAKQSHLAWQNSHNFLEEVYNTLDLRSNTTEEYLNPIDVNKWVELLQNKNNKDK